MLHEALLPIDLLQDLEDLDEEVDDVQVELDGRHDVLLRAQSGHDHLRVEDDEEGEEEGAADGHGGIGELAAHEDVHEPSEDEDQQPCVQGSAEVGEVPLGLKGHEDIGHREW